MAHISNSTLDDFVAGKLNRTDMEAVMLHLSENEEALAYVDNLWKQEMVLQTAVAPSLDTQTANRIERQLIRRIHQSDFVGAIIRFGMIGFGKVAGAIMMPIFYKVASLQIEENQHD